MHHTKNHFPLFRLSFRRAAAKLLVIGSLGCSSDPASLGEGIGVDRSALESYAAVWEGYMEAFSLPSGSDRVLLRLSADGSGDVVFGEGSFLAEPRDLLSRSLAVHEGFTYTIAGATVEALRIRSSANSNEILDEACGEQVPIAVGKGEFGCLGPIKSTIDDNGSCAFLVTDDPNEVPTPADCTQLRLCSFGDLCACDESACRATDHANISFDAALDDSGEHLEGTLIVPSAERIQVRFTRQ